MNAFFEKNLRRAKRAVIAVIGFTVLLIGVVMLFMPGPALLVVPIGLTILATEFVWARRLLVKVKERLLNDASRQGSHDHEFRSRERESGEERRAQGAAEAARAAKTHAHDSPPAEGPAATACVEQRRAPVTKATCRADAAKETGNIR
jgi:hypothetical protein